MRECPRCARVGLDTAVRGRSFLWLNRVGHTFNSDVREHADAQMLNWFDKHLRNIDIPLFCSECNIPVPEDISCTDPEE